MAEGNKVCEGCREVTLEVRNLEDQGNARHEEYLRKVGEYEVDKAVSIINTSYIKETIKSTMESVENLSKALLGHMEDEMEMHKTTSAFISESKVERRWVSLIGASIIGVMVWFYTTQYLPSTQETHEGLKAIQIELVKLQHNK